MKKTESSIEIDRDLNPNIKFFSLNLLKIH